MIADSAILHPGIQFGKHAKVEDYCIIGVPIKESSEQSTVIGDHALIRSHTVIYAGNVIGKHFQTGNKANIRELNQIGAYVSIGTMTVIEHHVVIGDRVRIHSQGFVPEYCVLEDDCWLGPNVVLTNAKYPKHPNAKHVLQGVRVRKNAKLGANCTILPGIVIGENSLVGAGSTVTKNVPDGVIVAGVPAIIQGDIKY